MEVKSFCELEIDRFIDFIFLSVFELITSDINEGAII